MIEKKLLQNLYMDFGYAGYEYLNAKKKQRNIRLLDNEPLHLQQRFIIDLIYELYEGILNKERFRELILRIFIDIYGLEEAFSHYYWEIFFKGCPPIKFILLFFGKDIGYKLIEIEENKKNILNIYEKEDALQYQFVKELIDDLFSEINHIHEDINSIFSKYLTKGPQPPPKTFTHFVLKGGKYGETLLYNFRKYLIKNMTSDNKENVNYLFDVVNILSNTKTKDIIYNEGKEEREVKKKDIEKEIIFKIGSYIGEREAFKLINEAKNIIKIDNLDFATENKKKELFDYIMKYSNIGSYSMQREKLVKTWLNQILLNQ